MNNVVYQKSIKPTSDATYSVDQVLTTSPDDGELLDVCYDWDKLPVPSSLKEFESRWSNRSHRLDFSGVWRFRDLLPFAPEEKIVTIGEGQTILQQSNSVGKYVGMKDASLYLQYEGLNPSGSFKDNGMTAAATHAHMVGAKIAACASTGNTSASLAIFASTTNLFRVVVFVGSGKIAFGKLAQALDYGAMTIQIEGDFDDALQRVREVCDAKGIYLCNSVNPFRLEGQKTIMYRVLEGLNWEVPDWIVVPGGNLGNSSAFGKAFIELKELGLIDKLPRLAIINASGANTLYQLYEEQGLRWNKGAFDQQKIDSFFSTMEAENRRANTLASAIEINRPVNLTKCLRALDACDGVVRQVTDQQILDAKAHIGAGGFGCEPASAASVAGAKLLRAEGMIAPSDRVVCVLTGHGLKDPTATVAYHSMTAEKIDDKLTTHQVTQAEFANAPIAVKNDLQAILDLLN
ncbi:Threonine synthase [hydrothermal vent metagenome]|uniref:Threonine synthase n=1 Tax=hydrothermal vent metagenome TaxID=652676 RepID=A0A3B1E0B3_9ZZZZ